MKKFIILAFLLFFSQVHAGTCDGGTTVYVCTVNGKIMTDHRGTPVLTILRETWRGGGNCQPCEAEDWCNYSHGDAKNLCESVAIAFKLNGDIGLKRFSWKERTQYNQ